MTCDCEYNNDSVRAPTSKFVGADSRFYGPVMPLFRRMTTIKRAIPGDMMKLDAPDEAKINRREDQRVAVEVSVTMESDSNVYVGFTDNISEGGLFVATYDLVPIGSTLQLQFQLPDEEEPISVEAEVRWHRPADSQGEGLMPGFGARFLDVDDADQERIEQFVDSREPMFHPD